MDWLGVFSFIYCKLLVWLNHDAGSLVYYSSGQFQKYLAIEMKYKLLNEYD